MRKLAFHSLVVALLVSLAPVAARAGSIDTDYDAERQTMSLVNGERSSRGKGSLASDSDLVRIARNHSRNMAEDGDLYHNDNLAQQVDDWAMLGENVGYGPDAATVHDSFMASAHHRENILESGFTRVGIGAVRDGDTVYITQVFMRPKSGGSGGSGGSEPEPEPTSGSATPRPRRTVGTSKPPVREIVDTTVTTAASPVRAVRRQRARRAPAGDPSLSFAMLEVLAFGEPSYTVFSLKSFAASPAIVRFEHAR